MAQIPDLTSALREVARGMGGKSGKAKANRKGTGAGAKARTPKQPKAPKELKPCECGCGKRVARHFAQGHDARLKSRLRKAAEGGSDKAKAELKQRGW